MGGGGAAVICAVAIATVVGLRQKPVQQEPSLPLNNNSPVQQTQKQPLKDKGPIAHRAELVKALPDVWKTEAPGLIVDDNIYDSNTYIDGVVVPDFTYKKYLYNSVFVHVYYESNLKSLQFSICEIDMKGKVTLNTRGLWENETLTFYKYNKSFSTPLGLLDFYRKEENKMSLNLLEPLKPVEIPGPIKSHPAYKGEYNNLVVFEQKKEPSIIYSYNDQSFFIVIDGGNSPFIYEQERNVFRFSGPMMKFESSNLSDLIAKLIKNVYTE